jgi:hypothetical protein
VAQANSDWVNVNLNDLRLAWFRIKLNVREAGARDEQDVAFFESILRGSGAKGSDAAGRVRTIVRYDGFTQQWLDDRAADLLCKFEDFLPRAQAAGAGENRYLRAVID